MLQGRGFYCKGESIMSLHGCFELPNNHFRFAWHSTAVMYSVPRRQYKHSPQNRFQNLFLSVGKTPKSVVLFLPRLAGQS